jgi:CBS-domain-containing membrane protein
MVKEDNYMKMLFGKRQTPPTQIMWSWLGAFLGIVLVSGITQFVLQGVGLSLVIGSFGASAVLIYAAIDSPLAQPRNLLGGHVLSALVGVSAFQLFPGQVWIAAPVAVATAIALMQMTDTLHPPGGATALIAVIGGPGIHGLGYGYAVFPVATGSLLLLGVALVVNRIAPGRNYPFRPARHEEDSEENSPLFAPGRDGRILLPDMMYSGQQDDQG